MARARDQHEPELRTVTLSTLHAAKGLEWPHVHIVGFAEGLLPISYASTFEAVDEERRLAYVGITRAARTLSLSWSRGQGRAARNPSRFLAEIGTRTLRAAGASSIPGVRKPRSASPTAAAGPGAVAPARMRRAARPPASAASDDGNRRDAAPDQLSREHRPVGVGIPAMRVRAREARR